MTETKPTLADVLSKFSTVELADFVAKYTRETESIAEANKVLEAKIYPADSREADFQSLDAVRNAFFAFAATVASLVVVTPGDPNGKQERSRQDKRQIEIPTPSGTLNVRLVLNN